ncbi:MAG: hypothetical protein AAFR35_07855 [Pseudomonadota bacterium]
MMGRHGAIGAVVAVVLTCGVGLPAQAQSARWACEAYARVLDQRITWLSAWVDALPNASRARSVAIWRLGRLHKVRWAVQSGSFRAGPCRAWNSDVDDGSSVDDA